jgi:2-desacetyl-2-hydroxyethyl bacteriochlorophyllide A dehydrogenase
MKAIRVNAARDIEIAEVEMPQIKSEDEVLIKVKAAGICGSDVHIYHGTNPMATYPRVIGHEFVGEVVEVGSKVTKLQVGDHVAVDPVTSCGECYPCSIGRHNVCAHLEARGVHIDGGFQEYYKAPEKHTHKISKDIPWEDAVTVEPFSISAEVVSRGRVTKNDIVFIMGAGPIGLVILQAVKRIGAKAIISDLVDSRLEIAKKAGADIVVNSKNQDVNEIVLGETNGLGATVVIDAVCIPQTVEQAVKLACPAGRVVTLGFTEKPSQIPVVEITKKELDVVGSRLQANKFPEVISWIENKEVNPKLLVSHAFDYTDVVAAFEQIENNPIETCKVILKF